MEYRVLPGFLRRREQRIAGLITLPQMLAGLGSLLPVFLVAQVNWLLVPLMLVLAGVAVYAMTPAEGAMHGLLWLYRLRGVVGREVDQGEAFPIEALPESAVPIMLFDEQGRVALAAEVATGATTSATTNVLAGDAASAHAVY